MINITMISHMHAVRSQALICAVVNILPSI